MYIIIFFTSLLLDLLYPYSEIGPDLVGLLGWFVVGCLKCLAGSLGKMSYLYLPFF